MILIRVKDGLKAGFIIHLKDSFLCQLTGFIDDHMDSLKAVHYLKTFLYNGDLKFEGRLLRRLKVRFFFDDQEVLF